MNEELSQEEITTEQVKNVPNPTGKGGFKDNPQNKNPGGRPKNSLKSYVAKRFSLMSDEEKEAWLTTHNITGIDQWKMGEGNPTNETELKGNLTISQVLDQLQNGSTISEQNLEDKQPL
mgnify:FL=1